MLSLLAQVKHAITFALTSTDAYSLALAQFNVMSTAGVLHTILQIAHRFLRFVNKLICFCGVQSTVYHFLVTFSIENF